MKTFIKYILRSRKNHPPPNILETFRRLFGDSINIEWEKIDDEYEAIFYSREIEQIARFNLEGNLISLKRNLTLNNLEEEISKKAASFGEVMNIIEISGKNALQYEIIYRDRDLVRYSLLLDEKGNVLSQNSL